MQSSESITKIAAALVKSQLEMGNAVKDAVNPFFKKSYADLNSVREAVLPILNKHGISAIQPTCFVEGVPFVETILLHESGEYISSLTLIVVDKINDAQRHGSGLSYARRYALSAIVNIGAEDDDANKATDKNTVPIKYTAADLAKANAGLKACSTFADLAATFTALSPELKIATVKLKDELKARLKPVA